MPVTLHTAGDLTSLSTALAENIGGPSADPFATEHIIVPSVGLRRWLEQQLAAQLGIIANVSFTLPGEFTSHLRSEILAGEPDPWTKERLIASAFTIARSLEDKPGDWLRDIRGTSNLMSRARYIGDLFDRYRVHRLDMTRLWQDGQDVGGDGEELPDAHRWQPRLWRAITDQSGSSPADLMARLLAGLGDLSQIPERLSLFGLSTPSAELLKVLTELANTCDVTIYAPVVAPSAHHAVMSGAAPDIAHPLLASWNRPELDGARQLAAVAPKLAPIAEPADTRTTTLARMQLAIRNNQRLSSASDTQIDDSVSFHGCSGYQRQVEVLRDTLLHLLTHNEALTESDIVVLCPHLTRFAPILEATWGAPASHDEANNVDSLPELRYSINRGAMGDTTPLIYATTALLKLVSGRVTHSELASFLTLEPVRLRFGLADDLDHGEALGWLDRTALRWGLTPKQRAEHSKLPTDYQDHTLRRSSDALIASMAHHGSEVTASGAVAIRLDLSQFEMAAELGDFADELRRIEELWRTTPAPMAEWLQRLRDARAFFLAVEADDQWQDTRLDRVLDRMALLSDDETMLDLADAASAFAESIATPSGRRTFGRGTIVVDQPAALRGVPHRVVCILGFDEDAIARSTSTSDDLIAAAPQPGDRDRRADAKQQLLEAVAAAQDNLVVTFTNHDVHTNAAVAPSISLQELLACWTAAAGAARPEDGITSHTRHAHTASNFDAASPRSFDDLALGFQQALRDEHDDPAPQLAAPLALDRQRAISVADLVAAITDPISFHARDTLGLSLPPEHRLPADVLPVVHDGLEKWALGNELLEARLRGQTVGDWADEMRRAGRLAPGALGVQQVEDLDALTALLIAEAEKLFAYAGHGIDELTQPRERPIRIDHLHAGTSTEIFGSVETKADGLVRISYSRRKGADEVNLWARVLLLASHTATPVTGIMLSRSGKKVETFTCTVDPIASDSTAIAGALTYLVEHHHRARCGLVPLFRETSLHLRSSGGHAKKASDSWSKKGFGGATFGDSTRPAVATLLPGLSFDALGDIGAVDAADELWAHIEATAETT